MNRLQQLNELGQSVWLNDMRRSFITSGMLRTLAADGIRGLTANARHFEEAITHETIYDDDIWVQVRAGTPAPSIHQALINHDVQVAANYLHDIYTVSHGLDGYVTLEMNPELMHDPVRITAEVRHVEAQVNRTNVMIEVPATPAGIEAVDLLTRDGVSMNITHIFSVDVYERVAQAYIKGLESFLDRQSTLRFAPVSVASFSLWPIDIRVDSLLREKGAEELVGRTAVCQAKLLYQRFQQIFSGPRWRKIERRGAKVLRPKWTRTTPQNANIADTYYVESLIGPDTITTISLETMRAFLDHGQVENSLLAWSEHAEEHRQKLESLDIDLDAIAESLQREYLQASSQQFQAIAQCISRKREELEAARFVTPVHH